MLQRLILEKFSWKVKSIGRSSSHLFLCKASSLVWGPCEQYSCHGGILLQCKYLSQFLQPLKDEKIIFRLNYSHGRFLLTQRYLIESHLSHWRLYAPVSYWTARHLPCWKNCYVSPGRVGGLNKRHGNNMSDTRIQIYSISWEKLFCWYQLYLVKLPCKAIL